MINKLYLRQLLQHFAHNCTETGFHDLWRFGTVQQHVVRIISDHDLSVDPMLNELGLLN